VICNKAEDDLLRRHRQVRGRPIRAWDGGRSAAECAVNGPPCFEGPISVTTRAEVDPDAGGPRRPPRTKDYDHEIDDFNGAAGRGARSHCYSTACEYEPPDDKRAAPAGCIDPEGFPVMMIVVTATSPSFAVPGEPGDRRAPRQPRRRLPPPPTTSEARSPPEVGAVSTPPAPANTKSRSRRARDRDEGNPEHCESLRQYNLPQGQSAGLDRPS